MHIEYLMHYNISTVTHISLQLCELAKERKAEVECIFSKKPRKVVFGLAVGMPASHIGLYGSNPNSILNSSLPANVHLGCNGDGAGN